MDAVVGQGQIRAEGAPLPVQQEGVLAVTSRKASRVQADDEQLRATRKSRVFEVGQMDGAPIGQPRRPPFCSGCGHPDVEVLTHRGDGRGEAGRTLQRRLHPVQGVQESFEGASVHLALGRDEAKEGGQPGRPQQVLRPLPGSGFGPASVTAWVGYARCSMPFEFSVV